MDIPTELVNESMQATVKMLGDFKTMFAVILERLDKIEKRL